MASAPSVLIVGAGPVGLVLAVDLARRKIPIRIIDTRAAPTTESRAVVVHARTLEMLDALGVADELVASGHKARALQFHADHRLLAHIQLKGLDSRFKFSISTPQTETERLLTERLAALGVVVDRGATLTGLDQDATGVRAIVRRADGSKEIVRTAWLVGADGSHSTTRALVGESLDGSFKGERFLMGDVEASYAFDRSAVHMFFSSKAAPVMLFPMGGMRARVLAELTEPADATREASAPWLQEVAKQRGVDVAIRSAHWLTTFEIHHGQVARYRVGRVFLAGDAAHVHSPAGGQGMNTGMQDAFNLGWKLALALTEEVRDAVLDSYHQERHPVAAHVIAMTTDITCVATVESRFMREVRNVFVQIGSRFEIVRHRIASELAEVNVAYRESPIVIPSGRRSVEAGDAAPDVAGVPLTATLNRDGKGTDGKHVVLAIAGADGTVPDRVFPRGMRVIVVDTGPARPDAVSDPQRLVAARYGLGKDGGIVVIRPDGYIGVIARLDDIAAVRDYQRRLVATTRVQELSASSHRLPR